MRSIIFLSVMNGDPWGGSEEAWFRVALWMCDNGYKVDACVFDWKEKQNKLDQLRKKGCKIYLVPNTGKGIFRIWRQKALLNTIPFNEYDLAFVNQGGWKDVAHGPFKGLYKKLPCYAISFHNYHTGTQYPSHKVSIIKAWIKNASLLLAASNKIYEMMENEYHIFSSNKEILYNPIGFEVSGTPSPYTLPVDNGPWVIVMLAALDVDRKAQDVLLKAFASDNWKQRNWQLHLYGEGQDHTLLENLIKDLQLEDKVFLKRHSNNVKDVLLHSHLLVQATHIDAMPISVTEGMAMARPCLVSIVGDMPDWVTEGHDGFITPAVTPDALNETLEKAWSKRNEWKQMGIHAHETFTKKYPQPYEEKFVQLLEGHCKK